MIRASSSSCFSVAELASSFCQQLSCWKGKPCQRLESLQSPGRPGMRLASNKTQHAFACMRSGCGSFAVPCSRRANATSSLFGDCLALVLLPVSTALSRQTCHAEFVVDTSTEKRRI
eukprot:5350998-Amphidinium_carterae.1